MTIITLYISVHIRHTSVVVVTTDSAVTAVALTAL